MQVLVQGFGLIWISFSVVLFICMCFVYKYIFLIIIHYYYFYSYYHCFFFLGWLVILFHLLGVGGD